MTRENRKRITAALPDSVERFRVTCNGEVHALGIMPNSNRRGWWFAGFADSVMNGSRWR